MFTPRYLIAEDEPLLAEALRHALVEVWPSARCEGIARDGLEALELQASLRPDVLFLDVRMPGMDGLEAARQLADAPSAPLVVFVTAYDEYAISAFERAAFDYLLKPVETARLQHCVSRLERMLSQSVDAAALLRQLATLLPAASVSRLQHIRAGIGNAVQLIAVDDILWFEVADKYLSVATAAGDRLIRLTLRELIGQLDPAQFWQVHRGTVVNIRHILSAERDEQGRIHLNLRGRPERLAVSRPFAHLFRQM